MGRVERSVEGAAETAAGAAAGAAVGAAAGAAVGAAAGAAADVVRWRSGGDPSFNKQRCAQSLNLQLAQVAAHSFGSETQSINGPQKGWQIHSANSLVSYRTTKKRGINILQELALDWPRVCINTALMYDGRCVLNWYA